ncbi:MAG TPA: flagellar assembly protein FliX [Caulobacteraceae bacterium]|jgi:hypothetical protein|nr:flagellar assembly protein FliX [Caulobacteraceae bacterium]
MKVTGPGGISQTTTGGGGKTAAPGFSVQASETAETAAASKLSAPGAVASVDALLALQEAEGPIERKKRAVRRAGRLLDVLDEVKLAILGEGKGAAALQKLAQAAREDRAQTDDIRLEEVLDEVETRAAVELAKAEMSRLAA